MGASKITYYSRAENDYQFIKGNYEEGRVSEVMCYVMQSICERYLKHIIDTCCTEDAGSVMRTHTIRNLRDFIMEFIPDFNCDWSVALKVDGYYFSARYPGDDAILVKADDVQSCWEATNVVRDAVQDYLSNIEHQAGTGDFSDSVVNKLNFF